jgi:ubiquinone/menaquinone biosynthesis C-methylase UbiE
MVRALHKVEVSFWRWKAPVYSLVRHLPIFKNILLAEEKNISGLLQQFPPATGVHLDLGSGTGDNLPILPFAAKRLAVDLEFSMLKRNPNPCRLIAHAGKLPFKAGSFAFVSAIGLLEYLNEIELFFAEVKRVLQPEGYFIFTSSPPNWANRLRLGWGEKLHFHTERQLRGILQANNWQVLGLARSWLQEQWLICREVTPV